MGSVLFILVLRTQSCAYCIAAVIHSVLLWFPRNYFLPPAIWCFFLYHVGFNTHCFVIVPCLLPKLEASLGRRMCQMLLRSPHNRACHASSKRGCLPTRRNTAGLALPENTDWSIQHLTPHPLSHCNLDPVPSHCTGKQIQNCGLFLVIESLPSLSLSDAWQGSTVKYLKSISLKRGWGNPHFLVLVSMV